MLKSDADFGGWCGARCLQVSDTVGWSAMVSFAVLFATAHAFPLLPQGGSAHEGASMELALLRDEYELARRYTQSLYADLCEAEVQWRPTPKSSGIAWHLGHQAAVNHFLMRNLLAAEPSLNPQFDALF